MVSSRARTELRLTFYTAELEINIKFPTCWDGNRVESDTGDHVAFSEECDGDEHNECFDFACPASHPVKMPEIHLYVRVLNYEGGAHMFSDGSDVSADKNSTSNLKHHKTLRYFTATTSPGGTRLSCRQFWTTVTTTRRPLCLTPSAATG